jgi:hypothetical protein
VPAAQLSVDVSHSSARLSPRPRSPPWRQAARRSQPVPRDEQLRTRHCPVRPHRKMPSAKAGRTGQIRATHAYREEGGLGRPVGGSQLSALGEACARRFRTSLRRKGSEVQILYRPPSTSTPGGGKEKVATGTGAGGTGHRRRQAALTWRAATKKWHGARRSHAWKSSARAADPLIGAPTRWVLGPMSALDELPARSGTLRRQRGTVPQLGAGRNRGGGKWLCG